MDEGCQKMSHCPGNRFDRIRQNGDIHKRIDIGERTKRYMVNTFPIKIKKGFAIGVSRLPGQFTERFAVKSAVLNAHQVKTAIV